MGGAGIAAGPGCWEAASLLGSNPVHIQGASGSGGTHAALSKGSRVCLLMLLYSQAGAQALALPCSGFPLLQHFLPRSLPRTCTTRWPDPGSANQTLWCAGHRAEELPLTPPETSSTALLWHSLEGELLGSDPHTQGLLQQQPGELGGLFYSQLGNGRMGVLVGWSVVLPSARDQSQFSHSFNDCPNICSQRVPVLVSQLFGGEEAKLPPVPNPQLPTKAVLPQRVIHQHRQILPQLQPLQLLIPQGLSQVLPKQVLLFRKEVRPAKTAVSVTLGNV